MLDTLYVVTCVFNPEGYHSRYDLYFKFKEYLSKFNVELFTVELALGDQEFVVTLPGPNTLQLRTDQPLWYKENLLNLGFTCLPKHAKYVAWLDADIEFMDPEWVQKTVLALQQHDVVQMFELAQDLGPDGSVIGSDHGFVQRWATHNFTDTKRGRSGLAWAARYDVLHDLGFLIDWGIVGSADWFMAFALTDQMTEGSLETKSGGHSHEALEEFNELCRTYVSSVGYVPITVQHHWHGKKADRGYNWRWKILVENEFNPFTDLSYLPSGLLYVKSKPKLLSDIRDYFKSRREDG